MPPPDYVFETAAQVAGHVAQIEERARDARAEADHARHQPGLDGPAKLAEEEAERLEALAADWREVAARVAHGYPYWEREGFEEAVDANGDAWRWQSLSETIGQATFAHTDTDLRLPLDVQHAYSRAFETGLFDGFEVCETFETDGEHVLATTSYLLGKWRLPRLGEALFLISDWRG